MDWVSLTVEICIAQEEFKFPNLEIIDDVTEASLRKVMTIS